MTRGPWVAVYSGESAPEPAGRHLVESLAGRAAPGHPSIQWMGVPATKVVQARKAHDDLMEGLARLGPERVLAVDPLALMALRGDHSKPAIMSERGRLQWLDLPNGSRALLLPTINPSMVRADQEYIRDLGRDVIKWATQDEPVNVDWPDYLLPSTVEGLEAALGALEPYAVVTLDIETTGFDPRTDELVCIGLGTKDGPTVVVRLERDHRGTGRGSPLLEHEERVKDLLWDALWPDPLRRVVLHNGKFDLQFLAQWWGALPGEEGARLGDTMLLSFLLDERPVRSRYRAHGLKDLSRYRFDVEDYGLDHGLFQARYLGTPLDPEKPEDIPEPLDDQAWEDYWAYQAMDTRMTALLWDELVGEAAEESKGLLRAHDRLLAPGTLAFAEVELNGIPMDRAYLEAERHRVQRRMDRRQAVLRAALGDPDFKPGSAKQIVAVLRSFPVLPPRTENLELMKRTSAHGQKNDITSNLATSTYVKYKWLPHGEGEPIPSEEPVVWPLVWKGPRQGYSAQSTSVAEMRLLLNEFLLRGKKREARIMDMILKWRLDQKYLKTYVEGLLAGLDARDRVHASFNLGGATTGRLSSSNPNMHAVPKRGAGSILNTRRAFRAEPGWAFLEADYSQLELRVSAMLSGDEAMVENYRAGTDLHLLVASMMFQRAPDRIDYQQRYMAKAVDFGILYGRSAKAISTSEAMYYLVHELGGEAWTQAQAQTFIDRFLDGFPALRDWMRDQGERALSERVVETPFGRRRRLYAPRSDSRTISSLRRQGVNTPIQSVASDICLSAVIRLWRALDPAEARILSMVHDSILLEVREDAVDRLAPEVKRLMETPPDELRDTPVPFEVDVKVGPTLHDSDMHDWTPS